MTSLTTQKVSNEVSVLLQNTGVRLIPFFLAVIGYFASQAWTAKEEVWSTIVKCLPIYCLIVFVVWTRGVKDLGTNSYFKVRLIFGLIFSSLGDLFLNIDNFEVGVVAFGIAQIFFIWCFGFQPRRFRIGMALYAICLALNIFLAQFNDDPVQIIFVFFYSYLLITMVWRGIAGCQKVRSISELPKLAGAIGAISFVISDGILGVNMFIIKNNALSIPVMITYYLAELGLALTCVDTTRTINKPIHGDSNSQSGDEGRKASSSPTTQLD